MDNENRLPELTPEEIHAVSSPIKADIAKAAAVQNTEPDSPDMPVQSPEGAQAASALAPQELPQPQPAAEKLPGEQTAPAAPAPEEKDPKLSDREVMEHTASIWRYRTVVENGTELHTEYHSKYTKANGCEVTGARARGKKHKHEGTNCDDWFETGESEGFIIAVVADGAGSKQLSRIGARVSCEAAVDYLKEALTSVVQKNPEIKRQLSAEVGGGEFMAACGMLAPLIQNSARAAFDAVINKLKTLYSDKAYVSTLGRNPTLADMGATFLAAVALPLEINGSRENFVLSAQIGDGCICAIDSKADSGSCFKLLGEADSGAYSGETDFLSAKTVSEGVIARKTRISRGKSDILMLMSDGVADDYFPAQPMMKRLYLDLCLNGILHMQGEAGEAQPPE
ncbi:MAG: protein phosphatase 2C domain-containing protein, partial [Oscillospiraceae bacterium]